MLCANSTGTEKLKSLVISRARRHHDFGHYKKLLDKFLLESIETTKELRLLGLKQALFFIRDTWKAVSREEYFEKYSTT